MGHVGLGRMPRTHRCQEVFDLGGNAGSAAPVANLIFSPTWDPGWL